MTVSAESWDADPDLLIPEGPFALVGSDTEGETSGGSSMGASALFSGQSGDDDELDWDEDFTAADGVQKQQHLAVPKTSAAGRIDEPSEDGLGNGMGQSLDLDDLDSSFSSTSSDRQATLKANAQDPAGINAAVLAVLASGAKGTVTKLESFRVQNPQTAGLDWDEDLVLPDVGLGKLAISPGSKASPSVEGDGDGGESAGGILKLKTKASWASGISDEVGFDEEDATKTMPNATSPFAKRALPSPSRHGPSPQQLRARRATREPQPCPEDFSDDFDLPQTLSRVSLSPCLGQPKSIPSFTDGDLNDLDDDEPTMLLPRLGTAKMGGLPSSQSSSISSLDGNEKSRLRSNSALSRPSLTPSLTTDRSSSPFTEAEFDDEDGFFDDLEVPPEFGAAAGPGKWTPSAPAPKGKTGATGKVDLQAWLNQKVQSRSHPLPPYDLTSATGGPPGSSISSTSSSNSGTVAPSPRNRTGSSASTTMPNSRIPRRKPTGYEDREDERVEDGLEIGMDSLTSERLRTRTNSVISSASTSRLSAVRRQAGAPPPKAEKRTVTVPFPAGAIRPRPALPGTLRPGSSSQADAARSRLGAQRFGHAASAARPMSMAAPPAESLSRPPLPRHRAVSLKPSPSSSSLTSNSGSLSRAKAPTPSSGRESVGSSRSNMVRSPVGRPPTASSLRSPASSTSSSGGLFPPAPRGLKHKKSGGQLRTPGAGPPPVTAGKPGLSRKQSMPSLSDAGSVASSSSSHSIGLSAQQGIGSRPGSRGPQTPTMPSYADPTRASASRITYLPLSPVPYSPVEDGSQRYAKRSYAETSPTPATSITVLPRSKTPSSAYPRSRVSVTSRLTKPTIASRLKSKPSVIHEDAPPTPPPAGPSGPPTGGRTRSASTTSSAFYSARPMSINMVPPAPHQLRRPKRSRQYGDGSELDAFDDLPTSKEKERRYTTKPVAKRSASGSSTAVGVGVPVVTVVQEAEKWRPADGLKRLHVRRADQARKRAENVAKAKGSSKKGLIRQMSMNTMSKAVHGDMKWNHMEGRWEGNEQVLRDFDNVLSSSSRPALITQLSSQSPLGKGFSGKSQVQVVGNMVFDPVAMCWHSREPDAEEELDFGDDDDRMDETGSTDSRMWENGTAGETTIRLSKRSSWMGDSTGSLDLGDTLHSINSEATAFWKECAAAEARHKEEMKGWIKNVLPEEEDRSYLQEIRQLVLEQ